MSSAVEQERVLGQEGAQAAFAESHLAPQVLTQVPLGAREWERQGQSVGKTGQTEHTDTWQRAVLERKERG